MRRLGLGIVAVGIALLPAVPSASAAPAAGFSADRVIVEWSAGASTRERREAREAAGVEYAADLGNRRFQLVETEPGQTPHEAIGDLEAGTAVVHAERDGYYELNSVPDDPLFGQLWGFQNTGLGIDDFEGAVAGDDIDVLGAWERTVGTPSTVVADIDGGYRFEHPDLANVAWTNPEEIPKNGLDDDEDGIVDDVNGADFVGPDADAPAVDGDPTDDDPYTKGHGLHTAGIIGAQGNNGIGVTGVAQNVRIMPLRACSEAGRCPFSAIVAAVNYAGAHGARVANMSLGGEERQEVLADAIAANPQTLFVISAGNSAVSNEVTPEYPCVFDPLAEAKGPVDNVVCVAATDQADRLAEFSNWGVNSVDLGAPGTEILSAAPYRYLVKDDFELDDFTSKWTDSGADGGFARTNESPLASFGISDSPGATPVAGSERASTSAPVTLPPGYQSCGIDIVTASPGGFVEILIDGEGEGFSIARAGRSSHNLLDELSSGGEVSVRISYTAGQNPGPKSGAWIEEIDLHCVAKLGEADGYRFAEGTSMAAPFVTGTAALLFSLKPAASVTEVREGLLASVDAVSSLKAKTTSGGRLDAGAATDLFDPVGPAAPSLSATNPASPSKDNQPRLKGSAQAGSSVEIYANPDCSGSPVASGSAAQLAGAGIAVTVADESVTEFSATATDLVPLTSVCSAPISYVEDSDLVAPAAPQLTGTDPASPNASGTPRILGTAEAGSTVTVYAGQACEGSPLTAASAAKLEAPGIAVEVPEGVTADFSATATDASDNTSACSEPISYSRLKATEPGGGSTDGGGGSTTGGGGDSGGGGATSAAECVVPKLVGKTLAQAKASLKVAACQLGKVRKPRPRRGHRPPPLVVKASTPAPGAKPADGKVDLTLAPKPRKAHR
ncbi:MAG TPA: S8 family serine peptidase [Solirubrobacterales bacterium]|nr:S8 family serine peptidase [Solirubrobacterales bacterium]